jgi:hypothetical protein
MGDLTLSQISAALIGLIRELAQRNTRALVGWDIYACNTGHSFSPKLSRDLTSPRAHFRYSHI